MAHGKLILIPTPLHTDATATIPSYVIQELHQLTYLVAERAKTARHFIKSTKPERPISTYTIFELGKHTSPAEWQTFLQPALAGNDIGLLSEAGCPGVADPGAEIVQLAHQKGIRVVPLVGPSSILLALMGSGLNGQQFCFHGYLSVKKPQLANDLKRLEQLSKKFKQTQIFIEAPYRNNGIAELALTTLVATTKFCIACHLTAKDEFIVTRTIQQWKKAGLPDLHKKPTIFLIG